MAVEKETLVMEVNGLGFQLQVPASTVKHLPGKGNEIKLHTYLSSREDGVSLYGFLTRDELDIFRCLLNVGGVGPKAAMGLLSVLEPEELRLAIVKEDVEALVKAPGIGRKSAQRIILELRDKLTGRFVHFDLEEKKIYSDEGDAVAALVALGYNENEAKKAVRAVSLGCHTATAAEIVRLALKKLGQKY